MNNQPFFKTIVQVVVLVMLASCSKLQTDTTNKTAIGITPKQASQDVQEFSLISESNFAVSTLTPTISTPSISVPSDSYDVKIDPAYFDGIIVLSRYYTLLDYGFYEEALSLYSSNLLKISGGKNFEADVKSVEVRYIYPYNYWLVQHGWPPQIIPTGEIRFVVGTTVFHKGAAWNIGGTPEPDNQTRFVSLVMEGEEWKLDDLNSSPWLK